MKIAFLCYSINDNPLEQKRMTLFLQSLLNQHYDNYEVILLDCSAIKNRFKTPTHQRLQVEYYKPKIWHPAFFRNYLALKTKADILIHVNADDIYSPLMCNFAAERIIANPNLLLHCRRRDTSKKQFQQIATLEDAYKIALKVKPRRGCCGDFQAITREMFMKIGGYRKLIVDNKIANRKITMQNAYQEDSWLHLCAAKNLFGLEIENYTSLTKERRLNPKEKFWILHLWHPKRSGKSKWDENYTTPLRKQ
jgi:hypothetical protein